MNLLAIDPGNEESGWCVIDTDFLKPIKFGKNDNEFVELMIRENGPFLQKVVIEDIASYGMAVGREVFDTCKEIGRLGLLAEQQNVPVAYIYRRDEKLYICGSPRANDANIRRALIDRFALHDLKQGKGTAKDPDWFYGFRADMWSAYAIAVTYLDMQKEEEKCRDTK